ncbi:MAG: MGMT family protein, partial [Candidatus Bathyarchaeota archaeon]
EASNPVPLLIPCHRVVRSDLKIGGYRYGKQTKWEILQRERKGYEEPKTLKINGKDLVVFPVGWVKQE